MREGGGDLRRSVVLLLFLNEKTDFCYSCVLFPSFNFGFDLDLRALAWVSLAWFDLHFCEQANDRCFFHLSFGLGQSARFSARRFMSRSTVP
jgi:hypothetical protein